LPERFPVISAGAQTVLNGLRRTVCGERGGATMGYLVLTATAVVSVAAAAVIVLVRRRRRRTDSGSEAWRIEAAATSGIRDARRQAHAHQYFNDVGGVRALRDRDSRE